MKRLMIVVWPVLLFPSGGHAWHGRRVCLDCLSFSAQNARRAPTEAEIDILIMETLEKTRTASASIAITRKGTLAWTKAYGEAYVEPDSVKAQPSTLYWIASITKTTTAVLVGQLVDEGRLNLDRDVSSYLPFEVVNPHFPATPITARLLMTHTSSIRDGSIWNNVLSYLGGDPVVDLKHATREYFTPGGLYNEPMNFHVYSPGSKYSYSNTGVALLGYICEVIAAKPFVKLVTERVLAPLEMDQSFWYYADAERLGIQLKPAVAMPYTWKNFTNLKHSHRPTSGANGIMAPRGFYGYPDIPAGMLRTSAAQLIRVASLMGCRGTLGNLSLLNPETVDSMLSNQTAAPTEDGQKQGLIFYSTTRGTAATRGRPLWGHNGGDEGASTDMFFTHDGDVGLVVLTNGEAYGPDAAVADGISKLEQRLFEFAWALPEPLEPCSLHTSQLKATMV